MTHYGNKSIKIKFKKDVSLIKSKMQRCATIKIIKQCEKVLHIIIIIKSTIYILTNEDNFDMNKELSHMIIRTVLTDWNIKKIDDKKTVNENINDVLLKNNVTTIFSYNADDIKDFENNNNVNIVYVEEYIKNKYALMSTKIDLIVWLFLQLENKTDTERCVTCHKLLDNI